MPNPFQDAFLEALGWTILNSWWQFGLLWILLLFLKMVLPPGSAAMRYNVSLSVLVMGMGWTFVSFLLRWSSLTDGGFHLVFIADDQVRQWYFAADRYLGLAMPYISIVYLVCLAFNLLRFSRLLHISRSLKSSGLNKVPVKWRLFLSDMAIHMNIRPVVKLWISEKIDTPLILGWIKPVILLPASALSQLNPDQLEAILIHELAHIKRNDYFWNIIVALSEFIFYFNPFARWIIKEIREERENSCDDWVLQFPYRPEHYAQALLKLEHQRIGRQSQLMLAARGSSRNLLLCRVKRMLKVPVTNQESRGPLKLLTVLAVFFCLVSFFEPRQEIAQFFGKTIDSPTAIQEPGFKIVQRIPLDDNQNAKTPKPSKWKAGKVTTIRNEQASIPAIGDSTDGMMRLLAVDNDLSGPQDAAETAVFLEERAYSLLQMQAGPANAPEAQNQLPYVPRISFQALNQQDSIIPQAVLVEKLSVLQGKEADLQAKLEQVQAYWSKIQQEKMANIDLAEQYNLKKGQLEEMHQQLEKQARHFEQLIEKQSKMFEERLQKTARKRKIVHI